MWTANPDIFESDDAAKSYAVSYRIINQYGGTTCRPSFSAGNPDTIGCVWTGKFDMNTLRVDGESFESGKKKLRIQKYPDTCGRGLRNLGTI